MRSRTFAETLRNVGIFGIETELKPAGTVTPDCDNIKVAGTPASPSGCLPVLIMLPMSYARRFLQDDCPLDLIVS